MRCRRFVPQDCRFAFLPLSTFPRRGAPRRSTMAAEAGSSIEELRGRLQGLAQMLGGAGSSPRVAVAVGISPPRSKPRAAAPPAAAARRPPPPPLPRHTARPSSSVLQAANAHARDAPIGGLLAKYKDAEAGWLKVRERQRGRQQVARDGEAKGQAGRSQALGTASHAYPHPAKPRRRRAGCRWRPRRSSSGASRRRASCGGCRCGGSGRVQAAPCAPTS